MSRGYGDEKNITDLEIIRKCSEGDFRAQEMLYKRYFSFAMSVCIRYCKNKDEAMEAVNDSYMKVLGNICEFDSSRPFKAWYGRILVNTAIDYYRRNQEKVSFLPPETLPDTEEIQPEIYDLLSAEEILNLFSRLPENYKIIFNLFEIEGYSHEEIGNMLGIAESTSRSNLTRAKKMLRALYIKEYYPKHKGHEGV